MSEKVVERKKLNITAIVKEDVWGDKNVPILKFKAKNGDGKENLFEIFAKVPLIEAVKAAIGKEIDCEVETSSREKDGTTYTDRKVLQVFQDGKAVAPKNAGGGGYRGNSPEERASIEKQTCLKCAVELGMGTPEAVITAAEKFYAWLSGRPAPAPAVSPAAKTSDATFDALPSASQRKFANVGEFLTAAGKELHMFKTEVLTKLGVRLPADIGDLSKAWETLNKK